MVGERGDDGKERDDNDRALKKHAPQTGTTILKTLTFPLNQNL
jgi:hypothetical protein